MIQLAFSLLSLTSPFYLIGPKCFLPSHLPLIHLHLRTCCRDKLGDQGEAGDRVQLDAVVDIGYRTHRPVRSSSDLGLVVVACRVETDCHAAG